MLGLLDMSCLKGGELIRQMKDCLFYNVLIRPLLRPSAQLLSSLPTASTKTDYNDRGATGSPPSPFAAASSPSFLHNSHSRSPHLPLYDHPTLRKDRRWNHRHSTRACRLVFCDCQCSQDDDQTDGKERIGDCYC